MGMKRKIDLMWLRCGEWVLMHLYAIAYRLSRRVRRRREALHPPIVRRPVEPKPVVPLVITPEREARIQALYMASRRRPEAANATQP